MSTWQEVLIEAESEEDELRSTVLVVRSVLNGIALNKVSAVRVVGEGQGSTGNWDSTAPRVGPVLLRSTDGHGAASLFIIIIPDVVQ